MARAQDAFRPGLSEATPAEVRLAQVRGLVWHLFIKRKLSWEEIARRANLCVATVENLAEGETKRPHNNTVTAILEVLGAETVYKIPGRKGFVRASEFTGSIPRKRR